MKHSVTLLLGSFSRLHHTAFYLIIFIIGFIVYGNMLFNGFVWDDEEQIVRNTTIQNVANIGQIFSGGTFSTGGNNSLSGWFFRPMLTFTYIMEYAIFGLHAFGFHLFQLLFHIVNGILLFEIIVILLHNRKSKFSVFVGFTLSTLFVVHSSISEGVVYIAAVSEVMYAFCNLLAFLLILKTSQASFSLRRVISFCILLVLGLLYKESSIISIPIFFSYLLLYRRSDWKTWGMVLVGVLLLYFSVRLFIVHVPIRSPEFSPISEASLPQRLLTIPLIFVSYLHIIFFPDHLSVSQHFVVREVSLGKFLIPLSIALLFLVLSIFFSVKRKDKLFLFGFLWFVMGFMIVSNVFPLDMTFAERWLYFPFVGLLIAFSGLLIFIVDSYKITAVISMSLLLVAIGVLGVRTMIRNTNWHDGFSLYSHDAQISKNSFDLENNLGVELFRKGEYEKARKHFQRSIELQPKWHFSYNNLGAVYHREGNLEKAKELYKKTLTLSDYYLAYENLALAKYQTESVDEVLYFVEEALRRLPYNNVLNKVAAMAFYKKNATESAYYYAQRAYATYPTQENLLFLQALENQLPKQ